MTNLSRQTALVTGASRDIAQPDDIADIVTFLVSNNGLPTTRLASKAYLAVTSDGDH
jgi:hypothetical protein